MGGTGITSMYYLAVHKITPVIRRDNGPTHCNSFNIQYVCVCVISAFYTVQFPYEIVKKAWSLGFTDVHIPQEYGEYIVCVFFCRPEV